MQGCTNCNGTAQLVVMNDDGVTYTIHLKDGDEVRHIQADFDTLKNLRDSVDLQMIFANELQYLTDDE